MDIWDYTELVVRIFDISYEEKVNINELILCYHEQFEEEWIT